MNGIDEVLAELGPTAISYRIVLGADLVNAVDPGGILLNAAHTTQRVVNRTLAAEHVTRRTGAAVMVIWVQPIDPPVDPDTVIDKEMH